MIRRYLYAATTALALVLACAHVPPAPRPPTPTQAAVCDAFCELEISLACPGASGSPGQDELDGTADDVPCAQVCRDTVATGLSAGDRACLDTAVTCEAAEACAFGR